MGEYSIRGVFWDASKDEVEATEQWRVSTSSSPRADYLFYEGEIFRSFCYLNYRFKLDDGGGSTLYRIEYLILSRETGKDHLFNNLFCTLKELHGEPIQDYPGLGGKPTWVIHEDMTAIQLSVLDGDRISIVYEDNREGIYGRKIDYRKQALKELGC